MYQACGLQQPPHLMNQIFIGLIGSEDLALTVEHLHLRHANSTKYVFWLTLRRRRIVFCRLFYRTFSMQGPGSSQIALR